jgi:hypothetical protein
MSSQVRKEYKSDKSIFFSLKTHLDRLFQLAADLVHNISTETEIESWKKLSFWLQQQEDELPGSGVLKLQLVVFLKTISEIAKFTVIFWLIDPNFNLIKLSTYLLFHELDLNCFIAPSNHTLSSSISCSTQILNPTCTYVCTILIAAYLCIYGQKRRKGVLESIYMVIGWSTDMRSTDNTQGKKHIYLGSFHRTMVQQVPHHLNMACRIRIQYNVCTRWITYLNASHFHNFRNPNH